MKVIGIDPAPGKGTHIFSGKIVHHTHNELKSFLNQLSNDDESCLICWDSPLTGPHSPNEHHINKKDFTQRPIESFFSRKNTGFKTPKGISVLGYAGCSHWTISRHMVGLPRTGKYDKGLSKLPFRLITGKELYKSVNKYIVEVHPAVAIWIWCKHIGGIELENWNYKNERKTLNDIWESLNQVFIRKKILTLKDLEEFNFQPETDDELDAFVSWLLGKLWLEANGKVTMLGSSETGSFLVPNHPELLNSWKQYIINNV